MIDGKLIGFKTASVTTISDSSGVVHVERGRRTQNSTRCGDRKVAVSGMRFVDGNVATRRADGQGECS